MGNNPATVIPAPRGHQRWTADEEALLSDKYGIVADAVLARKLARTVDAIHVRAARLGVPRSGNFYTAVRAGAALGVDSKTVVAWIRAGLLNARKAPYKIGGRGRPWRILPQDLEAFVKTHPERLDLRRMPVGYLRTLLRRQVPATHVSATWRPWTPDEDAYLINYRTRRTQAEMATYLNRSKEAVHYRLGLLRQAGHVLPYGKAWRTRQHTGTAGAPQPWTAAEDAYIRAHYGQPRLTDTPGRGTCYTAQEVGAALGRPESAIRERARRLGVRSLPQAPRVTEEQAA